MWLRTPELLEIIPNLTNKEFLENPQGELIYVVEAILFFLIAAAYFVHAKQHGVEKSGLGALLFAALYLLIYLGVPPHAPIRFPYSGQLFGLVPMLSLSLILFPEINSKVPASVTKFLGWFLLLSTGVVLIIFKFLVW